MSPLDPIPVEMRARDQWVCWRYVHRAGRSKPTKEPWRADGSGRASTADPATWTTFENASAALERGPFDGLGYVFAADDPYAGVDLDGCIDQHGDVHPAAAEIVNQLDSYTERTPSGAGMHVIVKATLRGKRHSTAGTGWGDKFEVYDRGRFFTVTGNGSGELGERQAQLDVLMADIFPTPTPARSSPRANGHVTNDDQELLRRAFAARNGGKFGDLWAGRWEDTYSSQSEADLALCGFLAFWTGCDPERIDRLFRTSALMRPKWRRADYRERTITAAIAGCREVYDPEPDGDRRVGNPPNAAVGTESAAGAGMNRSEPISVTRSGLARSTPATSDTYASRRCGSPGMEGDGGPM